MVLFLTVFLSLAPFAALAGIILVVIAASIQFSDRKKLIDERTGVKKMYFCAVGLFVYVAIAMVVFFNVIYIYVGGAV